MEIMKCKCRTIFYPNATAPDYKIVESTTSFYMRLDQSEGIDSALRPVFFSPELQDHSIIDIGCGLGFTSDFLRFQGRECLAFDPSHSARLSEELLGINISEAYANKHNTGEAEKKLIF
jgi:2-polyprenyl-3-methyl-5-hydroxy-6-metoxy-1,4-benzoquinol methylase